MQASQADEGSGEFGEAFMHEQKSVPAHGEAFELMEVSNGLLNHPADLAQSNDLLPTALRDDRRDPPGA